MNRSSDYPALAALRHARGITLMELMVVATIIAILAGISIPAYRSYSIRVTRTDAKTQLLATAQQLERCYSRDVDYQGCVDFPVDIPVGATGTSVTYQIPDPGTDITQNTFVLTAERRNGQTRDTNCGDFTLNERGVRGVTVGTPETCW